jgi:hypothetical protein
MKPLKNSPPLLAYMLNSGHPGPRPPLSHLLMLTVTLMHQQRLDNLRMTVSPKQEGAVAVDIVATSVAVVAAVIVVIVVDSAVDMVKVGMGKVNETKEVVIGVDLGEEVITVRVVVMIEAVVVRFVL